jgi:hypothetical protein
MCQPSWVDHSLCREQKQHYTSTDSHPPPDSYEFLKRHLSPRVATTLLLAEPIANSISAKHDLDSLRTGLSETSSS